MEDKDVVKGFQDHINGLASLVNLLTDNVKSGLSDEEKEKLDAEIKETDFDKVVKEANNEIKAAFEKLKNS